MLISFSDGPNETDCKCSAELRNPFDDVRSEQDKNRFLCSSRRISPNSARFNRSYLPFPSTRIGENLQAVKFEILEPWPTGSSTRKKSLRFQLRIILFVARHCRGYAACPPRSTGFYASFVSMSQPLRNKYPRVARFTEKIDSGQPIQLPCFHKSESKSVYLSLQNSGSFKPTRDIFLRVNQTV